GPPKAVQCNGSTNMGAFNISSNANLLIQGSTSYDNIVIFVDRTAPLTGVSQVQISGGGIIKLQGIIYSHSDEVIINGGSSGLATQSSVVTNFLTLSGSGSSIVFNYNIEFVPPDLSY